MNTAEILSIISICITSVFAITPFIKMIVEFFHAKIKQSGKKEGFVCKNIFLWG